MRTILLLLAGTSGGAVFALLHLPLPWLLGSMAIVGIGALARIGGPMQPIVQKTIRPVVGLLAGSAISPHALSTLGEIWPIVMVVVAYTLTTTVLGYLFFVKVIGYDRATAMFSSAPGGLAELTLFGGSVGANMPVLVVSHAIRVILVVTALPFAIQYGLGIDLGSPSLAAAANNGSAYEWLILAICATAAFILGRWLSIPGGVIIPAILLGALVFGSGLVTVRPPGWLLIVVQIVIGTAAGERLLGMGGRQMLTTALLAIFWAAVLIGLAGAVAYLLSAILGQPLSTLVLAFSPGGLAETVVIAYAAGLDVATIVLCQVVRIFAVHLSVPLLFRYFGDRGGRE